MFQLNQDQIDIMGIPNFSAAQEARLMRMVGFQIPTKAEAEQAYVIHWLLTIYAEHGDQWRVKAGEQIQAWIDQVRALDSAKQAVIESNPLPHTNGES